MWGRISCESSQRTIIVKGGGVTGYESAINYIATRIADLLLLIIEHSIIIHIELWKYIVNFFSRACF